MREELCLLLLIDPVKIVCNLRSSGIHTSLPKHEFQLLRITATSNHMAHTNSHVTCCIEVHVSHAALMSFEARLQIGKVSHGCPTGIQNLPPAIPNYIGIEWLHDYTGKFCWVAIALRT